VVARDRAVDVTRVEVAALAGVPGAGDRTSYAAELNRRNRSPITPGKAIPMTSPVLLITGASAGIVDAGTTLPDRADDPKLDPSDVARTVLFALGQPRTVDLNEIVIRPTGQQPHR
jgi:hypothetical protein